MIFNMFLCWEIYWCDLLLRATVPYSTQDNSAFIRIQKDIHILSILDVLVSACVFDAAALFPFLWWATGVIYWRQRIEKSSGTSTETHRPRTANIKAKFINGFKDLYYWKMLKSFDKGEWNVKLRAFLFLCDWSFCWVFGLDVECSSRRPSRTPWWTWRWLIMSVWWRNSMAKMQTKTSRLRT